jgi:hypothetical protein
MFTLRVGDRKPREDERVRGGFWPTLILRMRHDTASVSAITPLGFSQWELLLASFDTLNRDLLGGFGLLASIASQCVDNATKLREKLVVGRFKGEILADGVDHDSEEHGEKTKHLLERIETITEERDAALASREALETEALRLRRMLTHQREELDRRLEEMVSSHVDRDVNVENVAARANRLVEELKATRERLAEAEKYVERCLILEAQFSWEIVEFVVRDGVDEDKKTDSEESDGHPEGSLQ